MIIIIILRPVFHPGMGWTGRHGPSQFFGVYCPPRRVGDHVSLVRSIFDMVSMAGCPSYRQSLYRVYWVHFIVTPALENLPLDRMLFY